MILARRVACCYVGAGAIRTPSRMARSGRGGAAGTSWWRLGGGQGRVGGWAGSGGWGAWVGGVRVARQRVRARVRGIGWRGV